MSIKLNKRNIPANYFFTDEAMASWETLHELTSRHNDVNNQLVVFYLPRDQYKDSQWKNGDIALFQGEIRSMPGYGVFVTRDGITKFGYHLSSFKVIPKDEL